MPIEGTMLLHNGLELTGAADGVSLGAMLGGFPLLICLAAVVHREELPSGGHKILAMNRLFLSPSENEGCLACCIVDL